MARNIAWKVSGHDGDMIMHDTKQDIDYMYAQGWPNVGTNIFSADLYGNVGFPGKWSYSQLIEQSKKSSLLNFVTNGYRTTPNVGVYSGTSKTSGHYSFYREEVVANGTNSQITHRDPVAINTQAPQIVDYNVAANHTYRYTAYPTDMNDTVFATTAINPNATGSDPSLVQTPMINWSIAELLPVGPTTDIPSVKKEYQVNKSAVWIFKFNVSTGENSQNIGRDQVTNLAQYNKMAQGKRNYMSGTVSCYLGSELVRCTGEYTEEPRFAPLTTSNKSIAMLKAWRKFVASKNPKLLKDRKGNKYIVQLTSVSDRVDDNVPCQPSFVNFSWQEIESSEDVLITGGYENDRAVSATGSTMQTIKLPTPIIHGAAFIGDTIWNSELDTPAFEDSYHFIFSIENDPLTDYYEWSLTDITSPTNSTGYEKQTVRKENIAPIIIPNSDGSGSLDNVGAFQEGHKYMLRVRGRADNSAIEDSNYYSQVIECKWLWGPNKYLDLQDKYCDVPSSEADELMNTNWGFGGMGYRSYYGHSCINDWGNSVRTSSQILIGYAYGKNHIIIPQTAWSPSSGLSAGTEVTITISDQHNFHIDDILYFSPGETNSINKATQIFGYTRWFIRQGTEASPTSRVTPPLCLKIVSIGDDTLNCVVLSTYNNSAYTVNQSGALWSYCIGSSSSISEMDNIYPYSEIRRSCGLWQNGHYNRIAYEGEPNFSLDGISGDVFVEYPLFYYADFGSFIKSGSPNYTMGFPWKYGATTYYPFWWVFIAQYPYHYITDYEDKISNVCLPSSLHKNYERDLTFAVGFLSAYEISQLKGHYVSCTNQSPVISVSGTQLLNDINDGSGLVGLKYTDQHVLSLLMSIDFQTTNINEVMGGAFKYDLSYRASSLIDSNVIQFEYNNQTARDLYKKLFCISQRIQAEVHLPQSATSLPNDFNQTSITQIGAITYPDDYTIRLYFVNDIAPKEAVFPITLNSSSTPPTIQLTLLTWKTGSTDILLQKTGSLGQSSTCLLPCKYRGLENPTGNVGKLCSDVYAKNRQVYYYKNANVSANVDAGTSTGIVLLSNVNFVQPCTSGADPGYIIQNSNQTAIGQFRVLKYNRQATNIPDVTPNTLTLPAITWAGSNAIADGSNCAIEVGGRVAWTQQVMGSSIPSKEYVYAFDGPIYRDILANQSDPSQSFVRYRYNATGTLNLQATQSLTNAAFGTRFSTHRTHY